MMILEWLCNEYSRPSTRRSVFSFHRFHSYIHIYIYTYIHIYIYTHVCVCVCVCIDRDEQPIKLFKYDC